MPRSTLLCAALLISMSAVTCRSASSPTPMSSRAFLTPASNDDSDDTLRPLLKKNMSPARGTIVMSSLTRDTAWVESFWRGPAKQDAESYPSSLKPIHFIDRAAPFLDDAQICVDVEVHDDSLQDRTFEQMLPSCLIDGEAVEAIISAQQVSTATLWYRHLPVSVTATGAISAPLKSTAVALHASTRLGVLCCKEALPTTHFALKLTNELYGDGASPWELVFIWDVQPERP